MVSDLIRILLVEDNELNLDMLKRRLDRLGYEIIVATDGASGVQAAQDDKPDIILMDMSLPVMDGWEASRRLKNNDQTRDIPIIGLSAHAMSEDRARALSAGCDDYETKPVQLNRLLAKMAKLTGKELADGKSDGPTAGS